LDEQTGPHDKPLLCKYTCNRTKNLFFHYLDLRILNIWILLTPAAARCCTKILDLAWSGTKLEPVEGSFIFSPPQPTDISKYDILSIGPYKRTYCVCSP